MVDSISSQVASGALTEASGGQDLGKEAFLKLLVAQLQNQDPLNPQENHEFVAQLAQFSSLEQTVAINDRLDKLALQNQGMANTQVIGLVGKEATVKGDVVTLAGQGETVPISFELEGDATSATVRIQGASGEVVRKLEVSERSAGLVRVDWNGLNNEGQPLPAGPYKITVEATKEDASVVVSQRSSGTIESVSFNQGFPVLRLDNGVAVPVADLLEVSPAQVTP